MWQFQSRCSWINKNSWYNLIILILSGRCLNIPVYEKGYKCDAADIAFDAIREGTMRKVDVILIDTAGRM